MRDEGEADMAAVTEREGGHRESHRVPVSEGETVSVNEREQRKKKKKYLEASIHDLTLTSGIPEAHLQFDDLKVGDWWVGEARAALGERVGRWHKGETYGNDL